MYNTLLYFTKRHNSKPVNSLEDWAHNPSLASDVPLCFMKETGTRHESGRDGALISPTLIAELVEEPPMAGPHFFLKFTVKFAQFQK